MTTLGQDIISIQDCIEDFLPDVSVNSRTHDSRAVRVTESTRRWRPAALPRYTLIPFWELEFGDGDAVLVGDEEVATETKTGLVMGTYKVLEVGTPSSYSLSTLTTCLRIKDANGVSIWDLIASDIVTFSKDTYPANPVPATAPTKVRIYPVRAQWNLQQFWTDYQWAIDFPPTVRYQSPYQTLEVTVNDTLHWTRNGKALTFKLEHPMTNNDPVMPVVTALFKEIF